VFEFEIDSMTFVPVFGFVCFVFWEVADVVLYGFLKRGGRRFDSESECDGFDLILKTRKIFTKQMIHLQSVNTDTAISNTDSGTVRGSGVVAGVAENESLLEAIRLEEGTDEEFKVKVNVKTKGKDSKEEDCEVMAMELEQEEIRKFRFEIAFHDQHGRDIYSGTTASGFHSIVTKDASVSLPDGKSKTTDFTVSVSSIQQQDTGSHSQSEVGNDKVSPNMIQRDKRIIVFAVDGSQHSSQAFQWAVKTLNLSLETDSLHILHCRQVYEPTLFDRIESVQSTSFLHELNTQSRLESFRVLKRHMLSLLHGMSLSTTSSSPSSSSTATNIPITGHSLIGSSKQPGPLIAEIVMHELKAHVLVLGSRGQSPIQRVVFGSVSDYLLHRVKDCAVFVYTHS
jgi:hypothetical protein